MQHGARLKIEEEMHRIIFGIGWHGSCLYGLDRLEGLDPCRSPAVFVIFSLLRFLHFLISQGLSISGGRRNFGRFGLFFLQDKAHIVIGDAQPLSRHGLHLLVIADEHSFVIFASFLQYIHIHIVLGYATCAWLRGQTKYTPWDKCEQQNALLTIGVLFAASVAWPACVLEPKPLEQGLWIPATNLLASVSAVDLIGVECLPMNESSVRWPVFAGDSSSAFAASFFFLLEVPAGRFLIELAS
jgi:hypothetical protein